MNEIIEIQANPNQGGAAALKNRIKSSSQCVVVIAMLILIGIFVQLEAMKQANSTLLLICTLLAANAGANGLILRIFIAEFSPENPGGCQYKCIKLLAHNGSVLLMITSYVLLLLAGTSHAVMVVMLLVMCALVLVLLCIGVRINHGIDAAAFNAVHIADLERLLDFAIDVAYILYGGLIGIVFGYFKSYTEQPTLHNNNNSSSNNLKEVPELLIFFGSLLSALSLVVSSTPPMLSTEDHVVRMLQLYNNACAMVALVTMPALAYVLVGDFAILALVPVMAAAVAWVVVILCCEGPAHNADAAAHRPVSLTLTALAFGGAMAMFLKIGGSRASGYQGTLFLLIAAAVVSGLGWRMLVHRPPTPAAAVYVLEFSHWMSLMSALPLLAGFVVAELP